MDLDFIDLKLPSGTLWATKNVGANSVHDDGLYYSWGEEIGYYHENGCCSKNFRYKTYELRVSNEDNLSEQDFCDCNQMKGYNTSNGECIMKCSDNAVCMLYDDECYIPTPEQFDELFQNTERTNLYINNVHCVKLTSKHDKDAYIIFPFSGFVRGYKKYGFGELVSLWTDRVSNSYIPTSYHAIINGNGAIVLPYMKSYHGLNIRTVKFKNRENEEKSTK